MAKPKEKCCITCARPFHPDAFYVNRYRTRQDGVRVTVYDSRCKACRRAYVRGRKVENREAQRRYRAAHPEREAYFKRRQRKHELRKQLAAKLVEIGVLHVQEEG